MRTRLIQRSGNEAGSYYVEHFWLPFVGPTMLLLWQRLCEYALAGSDVTLEQLHRELGIGRDRVAHSLERLQSFGLLELQGNDVLVKSAIGNLSESRVERLVPRLREAHQRDWPTAEDYKAERAAAPA